MALLREPLTTWSDRQPAPYKVILLHGSQAKCSYIPCQSKSRSTFNRYLPYATAPSIDANGQIHHALRERAICGLLATIRHMDQGKRAPLATEYRTPLQRQLEMRPAIVKGVAVTNTVVMFIVCLYNMGNAVAGFSASFSAQGSKLDSAAAMGAGIGSFLALLIAILFFLAGLALFRMRIWARKTLIIGLSIEGSLMLLQALHDWIDFFRHPSQNFVGLLSAILFSAITLYCIAIVVCLNLGHVRQAFKRYPQWSLTRRSLHHVLVLRGDIFASSRPSSGQSFPPTTRPSPVRSGHK
jgi:hypothetical protein